MSCGVVLCRGDPGKPEEVLFQSIPEALKQKEGPFLEINTIPAEFQSMIKSCWKEEPKERPEFVSLYRALHVGEFEETGSLLERLALGASSAPTNPPAPSSSRQGSLPFFILFF